MFLLLPVILVGMVLETLSVGMVVPALGILMNETYFDQFPAFRLVFEYIGNPSHEKLIFLGLSGLAVLMYLKISFCSTRFIARELLFTVLSVKSGFSYFGNTSITDTCFIFRLIVQANKKFDD